jgi:DNA polymerase (family 10)
MPVHNTDVEALLNQVADLLDIEGANQFRVRAYRRAAQAVTGLSRSVADMVEQGEDLSAIEGIGKDLSSKIEEIVRTGSLPMLEDLKRRVPEELTQLLGIAGLGPRKVRTLYDELGITTLEGLREAAGQGRISEIQGFGRKTEQNILKKLEQQREKQEQPQRYKISTVQEYVASLVGYLQKASGVQRIDVAGSYRRRKETVKDLDILVIAENGPETMQHFVGFEDVSEVIMHGETRSSVELRSGLQVDLRVVPEASFGAALHYFTGSKSHNIAVRHLGLERDLKINEYGIFRGEERIAGREEEDVFSHIGLPFIAPELREGRGEIEAAREGRLPELIREEDILGDLHVHSNYTDGKNTLKELARAARDRGYRYLAVTDHTQSLKVARGLDPKRLSRQMEEIDAVNEEMGGDVVLLKGAEVDILEDGRLDLPDEILARLDVTVCSVHSRFNLSRDRQTERIIRAMDNPRFHILGHPTGRMINERAPYEVNVDRILHAARDKGCYLEINSQPDRLDLDDIHAKAARDMGVKMAISTDAHQIGSLPLLHYGIGQARRGWLEKGDVLNAMPLRDLKQALNR